LQAGSSVANFNIITTLFLLADFESKISGYFGAIKPTQILEDVEYHVPKIAPLFRISADSRIPLKLRIATLCRLIEDQERRLQELVLSGSPVAVTGKESKPDFWMVGHGVVASSLRSEWSSPNIEG